ncbi:MAG: hypothetical protein MZV64_49135 [Ignavibacteriales bacterium]|nr:hypothetical protein [Ignavibacteriales bacterium]
MIVCIATGAHLKEDGVVPHLFHRGDDRTERFTLCAQVGRTRPVESGSGGDPDGADLTISEKR